MKKNIYINIETINNHKKTITIYYLNFNQAYMTNNFINSKHVYIKLFC